MNMLATVQWPAPYIVLNGFPSCRAWHQCLDAFLAILELPKPLLCRVAYPLSSNMLSLTAAPQDACHLLSRSTAGSRQEGESWDLGQD